MVRSYREEKQQMKDFVDKGKLEYEMSKLSFAEKYPEPKKPFTGFSVKFWLALISAISAAALSGLRIFDRFYSVAYNAGGNSNLSLYEALAAIGAINVTIIALSFGVAYTKKKMSEKSMHFGLWVAVFISAIAGLGQSFYGLKMESVVGVFDWFLAFSLAAVTALEYLSGDMLGVEFFIWELEKKQNREKYDEDHRKWDAEARRNFSNWKMQYVNWDNKQRKLENIKNIQEESNNPEEVHQVHSEQSNEKSDELENKKNEEQDNKKVGNKLVTKNAEIISLLKKVYSETGIVPGVVELTKMLAKEKINSGELTDSEFDMFIVNKKGNVSAQMNKWINKNVDVKAKMFIRKFVKKNKELPLENEIRKFANISSIDANHYLSEFVLKNKNELLKHKVINLDDVNDAERIMSLDSDGWPISDTDQSQ